MRVAKGLRPIYLPEIEVGEVRVDTLIELVKKLNELCRMRTGE